MVMKFNLNLDSINYIKIVYKDRSERTCCKKAAIKFMGEREIVACIKYEEGIHVSAPQEVLLSFVCNNGLYRTTTTLKYFEIRDPYIYFTLQTPDGLEYQQNREYFRVRMQEKVVLSYKEKGEFIHTPCTTYDISANGIRLELPHKIDSIEDVYIKILFPNHELKTKAKFVRFDDEDDILKSAFRFVDLQENDMDFISQKCIQKQLEYKRSGLL